jgi:hypothetical protein
MVIIDWLTAQRKEKKKILSLKCKKLTLIVKQRFLPWRLCLSPAPHQSRQAKAINERQSHGNFNAQDEGDSPLPITHYPLPMGHGKAF